MPVPKIPVQQLVHEGYTTYTSVKPYAVHKFPIFLVRFPDDCELAPLRYAVDELIARDASYKDKFDTTGYLWKVCDNFFSLFKNWLVLPDEPINMRKQATDEFEKREREKKEKLEQERLNRVASRKQYRIECQYKRVLPTRFCKVRVLKITCLREESYHEGDDIKYHFAIEFDPGSTKLQKAARLQLAKALAADNSTGLFYREDNIKGRGCNWILHEYVLLAYSEWLELDEPIEVILAFEIEKFRQEVQRKAEAEAKEEAERQKAHEERQRHWEEMRRAYEQYQRTYGRSEPDWDPWRVRGQVNDALSFFDLDTSATQEDVKKKFRQLAKQYHPDAGGDAEKFKQLNSANQVLMQYFA